MQCIHFMSKQKSIKCNGALCAKAPKPTHSDISKVLKLLIFLGWIQWKFWMINTVLKVPVKVSKVSKRNCQVVTSPKKQSDEFVFLSRRLGYTWNMNFNLKYFQVVRIEKQIRLFIFGRSLRLDIFVLRTTDL